MLEFSPAVVQRGSAPVLMRVYRAPAHHTVRGSRHSYGYGRPVADPRRAPRATARKRPRARRVGNRNSRAGTPVARPARARDPTALANTRPTRRRVRADPPAGSAGAHADTREHTVHQGASKAARAAASWSGGRPPGPGPRGNQCLVRAGPRSAPRRGHARGPRPLASETKKRRKTSYR